MGFLDLLEHRMANEKIMVQKRLLAEFLFRWRVERMDICSRCRVSWFRAESRGNLLTITVCVCACVHGVCVMCVCESVASRVANRPWTRPLPGDSPTLPLPPHSHFLVSENPPWFWFQNEPSNTWFISLRVWKQDKSFVRFRIFGYFDGWPTIRQPTCTNFQISCLFVCF